LYRDELVLEGLEEWPELVGRTYSSLPEQVRRGIDRRYLSSIILLHETARDEKEARRLKQMVFERINSGGVKLEAQESRNAILNGPMNQMCVKLGRNPYLCRAWLIPEPDTRELETREPSDALLNDPSYRTMADAELVLRFFAFRQERRKGALKEYLDAYLEGANRFSEALLGRLRVLFESTISLVFEALGERAFLICRQRKNSTNWTWPKRPVTMVYDPLMASFSERVSDAERILQRKDEIAASIELIYKLHPMEFEGVYRNTANLDRRTQLYRDVLDQVLG
jgi:hypothetical protein